MVELFKERKWYRWGVLFSGSILFFSLFFPTIGVENETVQWYSIWSLLFFLIEWAQWIPTTEYGTNFISRSENAGFLTVKIVIFLGFSYRFWTPWVDLINTSDIVTLKGLFALIFFMSAFISLGIGCNWTILHFINDFKGATSFYGIWFWASTLISFTCVIFTLGSIGTNKIPFGFFSLCFISYTVGLFLSAVLCFGFLPPPRERRWQV
jgi:hypothetical protein